MKIIFTIRSTIYGYDLKLTKVMSNYSWYKEQSTMSRMVPKKIPCHRMGNQ
jgi:hypothetical protein